MLEAVIGVQRGRNLHGPDQPEPEQDPADGVARLPARDEGSDDRERERGRKKTYVVQSGYETAVADGDPNAAARMPSASPAPDNAAKPRGADSPATRHGA